MFHTNNGVADLIDGREHPESAQLSDEKPREAAPRRRPVTDPLHLGVEPDLRRLFHYRDQVIYWVKGSVRVLF